MEDQPLPLPKKKKPLTLRQEAVVALVGRGRKTKAAILREAGYSPAVVDVPGKVFDSPGVKEKIDDIVDRLKQERDEVLKRMVATRQKAGYAVLSMTLGTLNRDIELLSGRPTDRQAYELPPEEEDRLRKLLEKNKIK